MEASIMDGVKRRCGAVSGDSTVKNSVSLARLVMDRSPHSYLGFSGAEDFARQQGVKAVDNEYFITKENEGMLKLAKKTEKKTSGGHRKLEMEVIRNDCRRHVAFLKRKAGIINKAAELSVLTGCEVVVIVFSKGGKAYTFSTPSGDAVLSAVLRLDAPLVMRRPADSECAAAARELRRLEESAKRMTELRKRKKSGEFWWDRPVGEAEEGLEGFLAALKDLRRMVAEKAAAAAEEEEEEGEGTFDGLIDGVGDSDDAVNGLITSSSPSSVVYN